MYCEELCLDNARTKIILDLPEHVDFLAHALYFQFIPAMQHI